MKPTDAGWISPLHIRFALAMYMSPEPWSVLDESWDSEAGKEIKAWMERECLIDWEQRPTYATERLRVWVDHLCDQPLPETIWVITLNASAQAREG